MIRSLFQKYRNMILYGMIGGTCAFLDVKMEIINVF